MVGQKSSWPSTVYEMSVDEGGVCSREDLCVVWAVRTDTSGKFRKVLLYYDRDSSITVVKARRHRDLPVTS